MVHLPGFLTVEEIASLRTDVEAAVSNGSVSTVERGPDGLQKNGGCWRTSYLQSKQYFRNNFADLRHKLREAMERVDLKEWNVLRDRVPGNLNFRNVEWHQYGPGGKLAEPSHYDSGHGDNPDLDLDFGSVDSATSSHGRKFNHD